MKLQTFHRSSVFRFAVLAAFVALPVFAQSPFDTPLTSLQIFLTGTFARAVSVIAMVVGGITFAIGDGRGHHVLGSLFLGIGLMMLAVPTVTWLFG